MKRSTVCGVFPHEQQGCYIASIYVDGVQHMKNFNDMAAAEAYRLEAEIKFFGAPLGKRKHELHGEAKTPLYTCWRAMIRRCHDPKHPAYRDYGGRGITVCQEWRESYLAFKRDVGQRPEGMSLDRADNERGYEPGNVRWATTSQQARNQRAPTTSPTGVRGVKFDKRRGKFIASINVGKRHIYLGQFATFDEAAAARKEGERIHWAEAAAITACRASLGDENGS